MQKDNLTADMRYNTLLHLENMFLHIYWRSASLSNTQAKSLPHKILTYSVVQ